MVTKTHGRVYLYRARFYKKQESFLHFFCGSFYLGWEALFEHFLTCQYSRQVRGNAKGFSISHSSEEFSGNATGHYCFKLTFHRPCDTHKPSMLTSTIRY